MTESVWECPACGQTISAIELLSLLADVACQGCHATRFRDYRFVEQRFVEQRGRDEENGLKA